MTPDLGVRAFERTLSPPNLDIFTVERKDLIIGGRRRIPSDARNLFQQKKVFKRNDWSSLNRHLPF
jgi:hypothetical protein